ncbi:MAG: ubiquinone/menaquinone biosynthesis methyltransferase [Verrucomicrobium sp.]|nr:ubiquinone/menaquinone biosynthesis methyltransferase [Verrucomicrobium sp.]
MKSESGTPVAREVQGMFGRVAPRYDFLNALLSGGLDRGWRRALVRQVAAQRPEGLLDLATGSGEVLAALRRGRAFTGLGVGADFCAPMLDQARRKGVGPLAQADGLRLPFADGSFQAVTIAFGLRNLEDRPRALREIARVLAPGGVLYVLEFSHPWAALAPAYFFYLRRILPGLAARVGAPREAYEYLGDSIAAFPGQRALAALLRESGYAAVSWRNLAGGIVALHAARKG